MFPRLSALLFSIMVACPAHAAEFHIATFSVDVTIPIGHPCMGGGISPAKSVTDPLYAKGFVLTGAEKPFVVVAFDWCEIRGTSFEKWKRALAQAVGTEPQRVLVTSTHVHDAPVMDEDAEKLLRDMEATGAWKNIPSPPPDARVQVASVCQPEFNDACIAKVTAAVRESLKHTRRVTHFGTGLAKVERIASNRRFITSAGAVSYGRMSRSTNKEAQDADEGEIDPWLRTLTFWDADTAVCALHSYAVHPMSTYGAGKVSADFPGEARALMQQAHPDSLQIYATGCAGNVTAGKCNDGAPANKAAFAGPHGGHPAQAPRWRRHAILPLRGRDGPRVVRACEARPSLRGACDRIRPRASAPAAAR